MQTVAHFKGGGNMMPQLNSYVESINKESTDFAMMLHEVGGVPFAISIRYKNNSTELLDMDNWEKMVVSVDKWSEGTMFVRSTPREFKSGIFDISISPKTNGFRQEKAVKTLTQVIRFLKELNAGSS